MKKSVAVLALTLVGCSGSDFVCKREAWAGTFLFSYEERASGTCGPIPEQVQLITVDSLGTPPDGCEMKRGASTDSCLRTVSMTCIYETTVLTLTQQDESANELKGLISYTKTGGRSCSSTYEVTATRQ